MLDYITEVLLKIPDNENVMLHLFLRYFIIKCVIYNHQPLNTAFYTVIISFPYIIKCIFSKRQ